MTPNEILAYGFIAFVLLTATHSFAYRRGEDSVRDIVKQRAESRKSLDSPEESGVVS